MSSVTTEQAIQNAVASAKIEGYSFDRQDIELCRKYAEHEISDTEFIQIILADCKRV